MGSDFGAHGFAREAPALTRIVGGVAFSGALKRSFPRMKAGAPSELRDSRP
jgi:hypothetical protein